MTDRAFQEEQTRAGWKVCWIIAVSTAVFSMFHAPSAWVLVLFLGSANIVFYHTFVRLPWQRGVHGTREVLLLNNSRAISMAVVLVLLAVCTISVAYSRMANSMLQIGGLALLGLACAFAGVRHAAKRWKTPEDLERTARESSAKGIQFRSKYPPYVFVAISVIWSGVSRYLGDSVVASLIGSLCTAFGSHMLGALIAQQVIVRKLLSAARARHAA